MNGEMFEAAVTDDELIAAVGASVLRLHRTPWEYSTSAPLELITVERRHGTSQEYVLKHLAPGHLSERARRVRPSLVVEPRREIETYRRVLGPAGIGPRLIDSRCIPETGTYWLLIERVRGAPLYEAGDIQTWAAAARWLGEFHSRFASVDLEPLRRAARLITYDYAWYRVWLDRARRFFSSEGPARSRRSRAALQWLADRYDRVIYRLVSLPATLIHGELYPSNMVVGDGDRRRIYPLDWEMTGIGPGAIDLAALTSGSWRESERQTLAAAYLESPGASRHLTLPELMDAVAHARIHLAVQWLGWFGRRAAPAAHARDWLGDAIDEAEALDL